jgi:hypothetical protein
MSTQLIGFSMGGVAQRSLVTPASMLWPTTLVQAALFNTLHSARYSGIAALVGLRRERFFLFAFMGALCWGKYSSTSCVTSLAEVARIATVPTYFFAGLSWFSWVCWIAPENTHVNQLFGPKSGLGWSMLTFDWNQIAYVVSRELFFLFDIEELADMDIIALATPWWAEANVLIGFVIFYWIITPALYYSNVWHSQYVFFYEWRAATDFMADISLCFPATSSTTVASGMT